jgi:hypothetical protein
VSCCCCLLLLLLLSVITRGPPHAPRLPHVG